MNAKVFAFTFFLLREGGGRGSNEFCLLLLFYFWPTFGVGICNAWHVAAAGAGEEAT